MSITEVGSTFTSVSNTNETCETVTLGENTPPNNCTPWSLGPLPELTLNEAGPLLVTEPD